MDESWREARDVHPFLNDLGDESRPQIKAGFMHMSGAYSEELCHQCPNNKIVCGLFLVVGKYGREVVGRIRMNEANRFVADKPPHSVLRGSRWLLLRNGENSDPGDRVRLAELLRANGVLAVVYVPKDDMKQLWQDKHVASARMLSEGWHRRAMRGRIAP